MGLLKPCSLFSLCLLIYRVRKPPPHGDGGGLLYSYCYISRMKQQHQTLTWDWALNLICTALQDYVVEKTESKGKLDSYALLKSTYGQTVVAMLHYRTVSSDQTFCLDKRHSMSVDIQRSIKPLGPLTCMYHSVSQVGSSLCSPGCPIVSRHDWESQHDADCGKAEPISNSDKCL